MQMKKLWVIPAVLLVMGLAIGCSDDSGGGESALGTVAILDLIDMDDVLAFNTDGPGINSVSKSAFISDSTVISWFNGLMTDMGDLASDLRGINTVVFDAEFKEQNDSSWSDYQTAAKDKISFEFAVDGIEYDLKDDLGDLYVEAAAPSPEGTFAGSDYVKWVSNHKYVDGMADTGGGWGVKLDNIIGNDDNVALTTKFSRQIEISDGYLEGTNYQYRGFVNVEYEQTQSERMVDAENAKTVYSLDMVAQASFALAVNTDAGTPDYVGVKFSIAKNNQQRQRAVTGVSTLNFSDVYIYEYDTDEGTWGDPIKIIPGERFLTGFDGLLDAIVSYFDKTPDATP